VIDLLAGLRYISTERLLGSDISMFVKVNITG